MAFTYSWSDAESLARTMAKGIPISAIDTKIADMVSGEMWLAFPWYWTVTNIATGTITLSDGVQDYSPPANIYRLLSARITRTDVTPVEDRELDIVEDLSPDVRNPSSYYTIPSISMERAVGLLRLTRAVSVPSGVTLEIRGEFQRNPDKVASLTQGLWFPDQYLTVAAEGLLYWIYKLGDDPRVFDQYKLFRLKIEDMKKSEDYGGDEQMFPSEPFGDRGGNVGIPNV